MFPRYATVSVSVRICPTAYTTIPLNTGTLKLVLLDVILLVIKDKYQVTNVPAHISLLNLSGFRWLEEIFYCRTFRELLSPLIIAINTRSGKVLYSYRVIYFHYFVWTREEEYTRETQQRDDNPKAAEFSSQKPVAVWFFNLPRQRPSAVDLLTGQMIPFYGISSERCCTANSLHSNFCNSASVDFRYHVRLGLGRL